MFDEWTDILLKPGHIKAAISESPLRPKACSFVFGQSDKSTIDNHLSQGTLRGKLKPQSVLPFIDNKPKKESLPYSGMYDRSSEKTT